jgi:hypothetical protein
LIASGWPQAVGHSGVDPSLFPIKRPLSHWLSKAVSCPPASRADDDQGDHRHEDAAANGTQAPQESAEELGAPMPIPPSIARPAAVSADEEPRWVRIGDGRLVLATCGIRRMPDGPRPRVTSSEQVEPGIVRPRDGDHGTTGTSRISRAGRSVE